MAPSSSVFPPVFALQSINLPFYSLFMILPFLLVLSLGCSWGGGGMHLNEVYFLTETLYLALYTYKSTRVFLKKKKNSDQSYKHSS